MFINTANISSAHQPAPPLAQTAVIFTGGGAGMQNYALLTVIISQSKGDLQQQFKLSIGHRNLSRLVDVPHGKFPRGERSGGASHMTGLGVEEQVT